MSKLASANDDLALMRFEWLEALVRVSMLKFGKEGGNRDVSDSVKDLITKHLVPHSPAEVHVDPNVLRMRLYCKVRSIYCMSPPSV